MRKIKAQSFRKRLLFDSGLSAVPSSTKSNIAEISKQNAHQILKIKKNTKSKVDTGLGDYSSFLPKFNTFKAKKSVRVEAGPEEFGGWEIDDFNSRQILPIQGISWRYKLGDFQ